VIGQTQNRGREMNSATVATVSRTSSLPRGVVANELRAIARSAERAALLLIVFTSTSLAQRDASVPNPDPEIERKSFQIADGFEVNLFAADPILAKPIQMNFDPKGRLWIVSSEVYPQIQPGQTANDKVLILEDRDGDGRSDVTTVFADGLLIPTGVEPGDGGAYVANSTELLHLADTDGDGKADHRRVVLSGFGTEDTHHILHTLRWGFDGMLYSSQSTYIHSHIETPHGVRRLNGGGIWQFRPETMQLEVFIRGLINPWGTHFDRHGQAFGTDGAGGEGINYLVPGAAYAWAIGVPRLIKGLNPGSPKYCGLEVVSGRHLPDDWQGNLVTNDFRANRVCRFIISDDGSGFAAREQPELIKTRHAAFRPIDVKMGPDGAIYIADWYNPIIQHGEVDFRDPRRDHTRGRIWRLTAKGRPLVERPKLADTPVPALLDALKAPEDWTRHQAKRVLKERGPSAVEPQVTEWVKKLDAADPNLEHHRLEALWVYQTIDVVAPSLLAELLKSNDARVRAAAARVAGYWQARLADPIATLSPLVDDDHPRVRLEAVRALAQVSKPKAIEVATKVLDRPMDGFLDYALWLTARDLQPLTLPELQAGRLNFGGNIRHLTFALEASGSAAAVKPLIESLSAGRVEPGRELGTLRLVASLGGPDELKLALDFALSDSLHEGERLDALVEATKTRKTRPSGDLERLGKLLASKGSSRVAAARAAGLWHVEALRPKLEQLLKDGSASESDREAIIEGLAGLGGVVSRDRLDDLAKSDPSAVIRRKAVTALAGLDLKAAGARIIQVLKSLPPADDPSEMFAAFVGRRGGPAALAGALADQSLPDDMAKIGIRVAQESGQPDTALVEVLRKAGGLTGRAELDSKQIEALADEVQRSGDPARGETIFRRSDLGCLRCHAIAGAGGQVGPGLESIGASAPIDYLVMSIVQPDKAIKEGYHSLIVATNDGRVVSGIKIRQTESEITLRDAEGHEVALASNNIEAQKQGGSLMPAGLTDSLTRAELVDLVRFLSELGKAGPYAVGQARVVRRWETTRFTPQPESALGNPSWSPIYSRVSGMLPIEDLITASAAHGSVADKGLAIRFAVDVTTGGKIRLVWNSRGQLIGVNGENGGVRIVPDDAEFDLSPGIHWFNFIVDTQRKEPLRLELRDVAGSPARAQFVLGR
jgi:putative heme-binding domain-containing protein